MGLIKHHGFHRGRSGRLTLNVVDVERALLTNLLTQMIELVAPPEQSQDPLAAMVGISTEATRPDDPALLRLFPDAYADPEDASEFRRFTEVDLRTVKAANASTCLETLTRPDRITLTQPEAMAWLGAMNDLRLTLAARLQITADEQERDLGAGEAEQSMYMIYDWLTHKQSQLIDALS